MSITKFGRFMFGTSVVAMGLQHFVLDYLMTSKPPGSFIVSTFVFAGFLYKFGIVTLAAAGVCQYKPKLSFLYLGILILGWILFRHLPPLILNSTDPAELNALAM